MDLEEVRFSLVLGTPACPLITQRGLGPTLARYLSTKGHRYVCVWWWGSDSTYSGMGRLLSLSLFQDQQATLRMKADMR